MARIFYFCPDFPQPSGGIKTIYRHVCRLVELGYDAAVVHQKRDFRARWHGYQAPIIGLDDQPHFGADDLWVLPEVMADFARQTERFAGRRILLALSWDPTYTRLKPGERWQDLGINRIIAKSPTVQRFLKWSMDLDTVLIPDYIPPTLYYSEPSKKKQTISYLTRKDATGRWLRGIFIRKKVSATPWAWIPLHNLDEAAYAQQLRESAIYLPTTLQEGMHVSVIEAMACGCLVVGYHGIGGRDLMVGEGEGQNCILVENGDLLALGQTVEMVLKKLTDDPHAYAPIIQNALKTAALYQDPTAEADALDAFFGKFVAARS